jgi:quinoprotein glucose dehydrogenase
MILAKQPTLQHCILTVLFSVFLLFLAGCTSDSGSPATSHTTWHQYGGSADHSKYSAHNQINKENVNQLKMAWFYPAGDTIGYFANPIIVDTIMYVIAKNFSLVALHAVTGKELWIHAKLSGITRRGLSYWESKDKKDKRILFTMNNTLQAIDALTGKSILSFGNNGSVDLKEGLLRDPATIARIQSNTPGTVFEDLILMGSSPGEGYFSPPGHVRAYNVVTGKLVWTFHTIPQPGEFGYDTWPKDAYKYVGGANAWGEISIDEKRGIAYFPLGSPTYDYYAADRLGSNLFGNCLLALDARTGKRLWHFQTVHHDVWDYDLTAAPQLITVQHDGKKIDAVAQATKHGFVFVLNRVTGEPLWPVEERPFPASEMPGEQTWPTQPIPTVVPSFSRHAVTVDDINPYFSPEEKDKWKKRIDSAKSGLFIPPSDKYETMIIPGAVGGVNFGNTASDPAKGMLYVLTQDHPSVYKLEKVRPPQQTLTANETQRVKMLYAGSCRSCHGENMLGGVAPNIVNAGQRIDFAEFQTLLANGRGQMPGFPHIDENTLTALYKYLGGSPLRGRPPQGGSFGKIPDGPVVDSGGAPVKSPQARVRRILDYPEGVAHPADRYTSDYGLSWSDLLAPVWSWIVAYDLNTGTIKWKKPLGLDPDAAKNGGKETGVPAGSIRKGMIITSTGVVFATAKGGKLYAFDADNGNILWETEMSHEITALPSTYQVNGRQYIVISATAPFGNKSIDRSKEPGALPTGYVVYALP